MTTVWSEAFNRGDVEGIAALYEASAVLARPSGPPVSGHDAIRQAFAGIVGSLPKIEARNSQVLQHGDLALTFGEWTLRARNPDGTPRVVSGRSVEVLRRQADGTWLYVIDAPYSPA
jgi:ketosteroid isomerase-like protein